MRTRDKPLLIGRGADIWVDNPGAGQHELRLSVKNRAGTGTATSTFEVLPTTREDEPLE